MLTENHRPGLDPDDLEHVRGLTADCREYLQGREALGELVTGIAITDTKRTSMLDQSGLMGDRWGSAEFSVSGGGGCGARDEHHDEEDEDGHHRGEHASVRQECVAMSTEGLGPG
jgi:hypothetical protein